MHTSLTRTRSVSLSDWRAVLPSPGTLRFEAHSRSDGIEVQPENSRHINSTYGEGETVAPEAARVLLMADCCGPLRDYPCYS